MKLKISFLSVLFLPLISWAKVKPNNLFSEHMVLQQGVKVPVWGTAANGEKVIVSFSGQKIATIAKNGKWMVVLKPLKAGGPFVMTISGDNIVLVNDVLVGEVWVCSGQSNMERQLGPRPPQKPILNWEKTVNEANYPKIREFFVPHIASDVPLSEIESKWQVCSPLTVKEFSAVGYFFALELHKRLNVPVGILFSAWGGSPAENWTSRAALSDNPELALVVQNYDKAFNSYPEKLAQFKKDEPYLIAKWTADTALAKKQNTRLPNKPSEPSNPAKSGAAGGMYNAMIAPLIPYAIKGVSWYQGESNNDRAGKYQTLLTTLIKDWRNAWGNEFAFLIVQIAPFRDMKPELREAQFLTWRSTSQTALIVTTDCGDAEDIHPANKEPVGLRLALAAMALAYKQKLEYSGPAFKDIKFVNHQAVLSFDHTGTGLVVNDAELKGFSIAGADHNFLPAKAKISGRSIIVFNDSIATPKAVRYGWDNVPKVNLFNKEGFPASPFRTDFEK